MILPVSEALRSDTHSHYKAAAEASLEYQIGKVEWYLDRVGECLDQQQSSPFSYSIDSRSQFYFDGLIGAMSPLTEYYHAWVVFSRIGTTRHGKVIYKPIKDDSGRNAAIDRMLKSCSVGVTSDEFESSEIILKESREEYVRACEFLWTGRFNELYVVNNYLKHNSMLFDYAPRIDTMRGVTAVPYIYVERPFDSMINESVFKYLFDNEVGVDVVPQDGDYFGRLIAGNVKEVIRRGGFRLCEIDGIEYLKVRNSVGLTIESIYRVARDQLDRVIDEYLSTEGGNITLTDRLRGLKRRIWLRSSTPLSEIVPAP